MFHKQYHRHAAPEGRENQGFPARKTLYSHLGQRGRSTTAGDYTCAGRPIWASGQRKNWKAGETEKLLRVCGASALHPRSNPLHLVLAVQLHLLKFDFFQEVFGTEVGPSGEFLKFCLVFRVLLGQTLVL